MTKGVAVTAVALGMVSLGLTTEVAVENGSDLGLLASSMATRSSSSAPSSLSEPQKLLPAGPIVWEQGHPLLLQ